MKGLIFPAALYLLSSLAPAEVSIEKTIAACKSAGVEPVSKPIQSELKKETSLIGMAYLNYIYQNDLTNLHFRQAMTLMSRQVPPGTENIYVGLFAEGMGNRTMPILQEVQLAFDYSIARSNPSEKKLQAAIRKIRAALGK